MASVAAMAAQLLQMFHPMDMMASSPRSRDGWVGLSTVPKELETSNIMVKHSQSTADSCIATGARSVGQGVDFFTYSFQGRRGQFPRILKNPEPCVLDSLTPYCLNVEVER